MRPIVGVPTSVAAFVGLAPQGIVDYPFQVNCWADYENQFGGLDSDWPMSYAVYLFFLNGGATALIVRADNPSDTTNYSVASLSLSSDITLQASSPGAWGTNLWATVDTTALVNPAVNQFNLTIRQVQQSTSGAQVVSQEVYAGANLIKGTPQYLPTLLAGSRLVTPAATNGWTKAPSNTPSGTSVPGTSTPGAQFAAPKPAAPADPADDADAQPPVPLGDPAKKTGIYALTKADIFNILCLPVDPANTYDPTTILEPAAAFCVPQRAMLIVDPPKEWASVAPLDFHAISTNPPLTPSANAAVYYPNLTLPDNTGATITVGPCGAVAGVWAATDSGRGVWKAPAGTAAAITGITDFTAHIDDGESGTINPLAVNGLRTMPAAGPVIWGARTTVGADQAQNQWKYLPVRRLALFIEESLRRGTQWAVFEPNAEPLWSSLRLNVTAFMQGLFRKGAFAGSTPADAYLVQCDVNNNPPDQVALGIVNVLVGFAPLYPAEFVIINIQQQQPGQS
ncbi:tail protein [Mycobacterium kiyosense]|uniref:Tail protein n=1 Tax=Mycobacterium kiyosense TaxID=2871094 RepID=A0AA37UZB1_9MYCO|nr:tail protein [Mycobacterium kiyosense]BDE16964.1 tail protein [Mycobacterium sp. 20KCMC460]GLB83523.1 tail protein [Mycobacterium kiyosense]GLB91396.1 tail protein [Mycobacterium kiyosense]GLB97546.1 tail protein [Mycobacterium kiyosense]